MRCLRSILARDFEVQGESENLVMDDKAGSQLEVRGWHGMARDALQLRR